VFAADGTLADPKVRVSLAAFLDGFVAFVRGNARPKA